jgi:hypothetical protein
MLKIKMFDPAMYLQNKAYTSYYLVFVAGNTKQNKDVSNGHMSHEDSCTFIVSKFVNRNGTCPLIGYSRFIV